MLERLLRLCPSNIVDPPTFPALEDVRAVLEATIKYGMDRLEQRVRRVLVAPQFIENEPMRVFGIACHFKLEKMTGGDHYRLEYHAECSRVARTVTDIPILWIERDSFWLQCASHNDLGRYSLAIP